MKNYMSLLVIGLLILLGACNEKEFLDRYPQDRPNPGNFFVNAESARQAVNACYYPWTLGNINMLQRDMLIALDGMSDDNYMRPAQAYINTLLDWNVEPSHQIVSRWWDWPYRCINAANFAIDNIPLSSDPNFTAEQQAPYVAEAKFFRAFSYIFLTLFYGDVPLRLTAASDFSEFSIPRTPEAEVLQQVIEDFKYARDFLPEEQTVKGTPTKASAAAFLAKGYLWMQDWSNAETAGKEAVQIAESTGYKLQDDYLSIWKEEGNPELLFYWGFSSVEGYGQNMTVMRLCRDLPPTLSTAINGTGWGYVAPTLDLFNEFEPDDPRREYTMYYPGTDYEIYPGPDDFPYTHEIMDESGNKTNWDVVYKAGDMVQYDYRWAPTGMNGRKYTKPVIGDVRVENDGMDMPVMRLAELYLIVAEALAEQGKTEALTWVNKVRSRASVNISGRTLNDGRKGSGSLVEIVRHERRVELALEGSRTFDLIRWGIAIEVFGDGKKVKRSFYSDLLPESSSLKYAHPSGRVEANPIFPTPQSELDINTEINTQIGDWQ